MASTQIQQAEQAVAQLAGTWRGCPKVTVVGSAHDLPFAAPADVRGAYVPRSENTFIVAGNRSTLELHEILAHEVLAHHALRADLGLAVWTSFMYAIQAGVRGGDSRLAAIRQHVREIYVDQAGYNYLRASSEADEVAAVIVEGRFNGKTGRLDMPNPWRARLNAALGYVHREVLYGDRPATFEEVEGRLLAAEHRLRHGGPIWGLGYRIKHWYALAMAKPWNPIDRPMSLSESEELLRADRAAKRDRAELKFVFQGASLFAAIAGWMVCIGLIVWGIFAFLTKVIH